MSFHCELRRVGDVVVLDLSGRFVFGDGASLAFDQLVREQIQQGCKNVLINLEKVNYTDTGGLSAMLRVLTTVTEHGGTLRFCGAKGTVLEVLQVTRLEHVLNAGDDEATAIASFAEKRLGKGSAA